MTAARQAPGWHPQERRVRSRARASSAAPRSVRAPPTTASVAFLSLFLGLTSGDQQVRLAVQGRGRRGRSCCSTARRSPGSTAPLDRSDRSRAAARPARARRARARRRGTGASRARGSGSTCRGRRPRPGSFSSATPRAGRSPPASPGRTSWARSRSRVTVSFDGRPLAARRARPREDPGARARRRPRGDRRARLRERPALARRRGLRRRRRRRGAERADGRADPHDEEAQARAGGVPRDVCARARSRCGRHGRGRARPASGSCATRARPRPTASSREASTRARGVRPTLPLAKADEVRFLWPRPRAFRAGRVPTALFPSAGGLGARTAA